MLEEPEVLVAELDIEGEILCNGDVVDAIVTAMGGTMPYQIFSGDTFVGEFDNGTFIVPGIGAGEYLWTVIDANGCEAIVEFMLEEPELLEANVEIEGEILCNGDVVDAIVTATGGTMPYQIFAGEVFVGDFDDNTFIVPGIGAGSYSWTVVDANGCEAMVEFTLTEPELLVADWESETPCFGEVVDVTITADGGTLPYQLFDGEVLVAEFDGTFVVPGIGTGSYFWTVVDANGCSVDLEVEIDEYPLPEVSLDPFELDQVCTTTPAFALTGGMPEGGMYSGPGVVDGNIFDPSLVTTGVHEITYTYTDENGCSASATQTIEVEQGPCVEVIITDVTCNGTNTGGIKIIVDPSCVHVIEICIVTSEDLVEDCLPTDKISGANYFNLPAGTYYIVVVGANGCYEVIEATINEPELLVADYELAANIIPEGTTTTVTITATGGTPPYTGTGEFTVGVGQHLFTVTDANGCQVELTVTVETDAVAVFYPNYPNPFKTSTAFEFKLFSENHVRIEVLNVYGQVMEIITDQYLPSGDYKYEWAPRGFKSGIYLLRATVGNQVHTSKIIFQP